MIKSIWIDNFKSLVDFKLEPAKFTCLVGLNGVGKSTVLQAMDFISHLMTGEVEAWLKQRHWDRGDINSKLTTKSNIEFEIIFNNELYGDIMWRGSVNRKTLHCTREYVKIGNKKLLNVDDAHCSIAKIKDSPGSQFKLEDISSSERFPVVFEYQGSILSQLKETQITPIPILKTLKEAVLEIRSLDLLSPELLRSQAKSADGELGLGGKKLSAFIHESGKKLKDKLTKKLSEIYGQLNSIETKSLRSGWKQLEITEQYDNHTFTSTARHMNDGMLRLMAVLAQLESDSEFLLFDEIENGINTELIEYLIDHLVKAKQQIMVTTHSPMILNFLEDDIAMKGVMYIYKTGQGHTKSIRFFDIPSMKKKLDFMGPGEVFVDTDLINLCTEIAALPVNWE